MIAINQFRRCAFACLTLFATGCFVPAVSYAETTDTLPSEIPIGPADDNAVTSRAVTKILDDCVAAYVATDAMHSTGNYIAINKSEDQETTYVQAEVTINFRRPDKLAVISRSESSAVDCTFIADGARVTMVDSSHKSYSQMAQPKSLAAYCDSHRAGEIYDEESGAMGISAVAPMLISEDPRGILYEGISRYIYEGEETVSGSDCQRIRFIQKDPDIIVILWIDKETSYIRKASFINSYDADYNMVESYEEGVNASMMIMTWDKISTAPEDVNEEAFDAEIPEGYEAVTDVKVTVSDTGKTSLWESLVSTAARTSPVETTWSLVRQSGARSLRLEEFAMLPHSLTGFDTVTLSGTSKLQMAVVSKDGIVTFHRPDGGVETTISLGLDVAMFGTLATGKGPALLAVTENKDELIAYDLSGKLQWRYKYPQATIRNLRPTSSTQPAVYLALSGSYGVRKLNAAGEVAYASVEESYISSLSPAPAGVDRVLGRGVYELAIYDKNLHLLSTATTDENLPSMLWDSENATFPIINIGISADSDILLQRRAENGDILWTTMIAPKVEGVTGSGLAWYNANIDGQTQRCLMVLLSDGLIVLTSESGKVLYRGQIMANDELVKRNDGNVVTGLNLADLDGDGLDEVYTKMDNHVLRLVTTP